MNNVPEVFLAREAQLAYATVGIATDYDCGMEDPARHVSVTGIFEPYGQSLGKARSVLDHLLAQPLPEPEPAIHSALQGALLTRDDALLGEQKEWLSVLCR